MSCKGADQYILNCFDDEEHTARPTHYSLPVSSPTHTQAAFAAKLPFPLSYIIPWSQQREMQRKYGHLTARKVCRLCVGGGVAGCVWMEWAQGRGRQARSKAGAWIC